MARKPEPVKILAPHSFRQTLSRRSVLQMGGAAAGLGILGVACGGSDEGGDGGDGGTQASGDWSRVVDKAEGTLSMYTWGDYNDPELVGALAES